MFIKLRIYLDDEYVVMAHNYFLQYTQLEILEFHDTLIYHMESVKKSIDERAQHKREYDSGKEWDKSKEQDTSSKLGNDAHADDTDIRPIYNEEPIAEVQMTIEINVFVTRQQHTEQPEFNNEGEIPTGKIFDSSRTKFDIEPPNGSNEDITNPYECEKTLNVSACTLNLSACTSFNPKKEGLRVWLLKRLISQKPRLQGILI
ncbi:hypothetical protein Tco_0422125 [Tanacetum coccineum]